MAIKLVHVECAQELRFGDRSTAERYAECYGGREAWRVVTVPRPAPSPKTHATARAQR